MKSIIVNFLKNDRSFETGKQLYMQHGPSMAFKTVLNRQGFSDYNHRLLLEELRKLAGITMQEFTTLINTPKVQVITDQQKQEFITALPEEFRKAVRLRQEFPFLNAPDCPDILKILVADRIASYHRYVEAHQKLFDACSEQQITEAASVVVENYLDNQAIWDELNHYKEKGELLGKHPIFEKKDRMEEIRKMATPELVKLQKSLMNNLARTRKDVKDHPDHKETGNRLKRIENFEFELTLVNHLLGLDA